MELMSGKSEENGDDVADIIIVNYSYQNFGDNSITYGLHSATPPGEYHVRMNGTIWNGSTQLSTTTARSATFNVTEVTPFACSTPAWTPVRSLTDPGYTPLRITSPAGGDVHAQTELSSRSSQIAGLLTGVDASFDTKGMTLTAELFNTATGFNAGVQTFHPERTFVLGGDYFTGNTTLDPGPWKMRMNFTSTNVHNPGTFVALSDEFYVVLEAPCVGLTSNNSTSATSTGSSQSTAAPGSGPGSTADSGAGSGPLPSSGSGSGSGSPPFNNSATRRGDFSRKGHFLYGLLFLVGVAATV